MKLKFVHNDARAVGLCIGAFCHRRGGPLQARTVSELVRYVYLVAESATITFSVTRITFGVKGFSVTWGFVSLAQDSPSPSVFLETGLRV